MVTADHDDLFDVVEDAAAAAVFDRVAEGTLDHVQR